MFHSLVKAIEKLDVDEQSASAAEVAADHSVANETNQAGYSVVVTASSDVSHNMAALLDPEFASPILCQQQQQQSPPPATDTVEIIVSPPRFHAAPGTNLDESGMLARIAELESALVLSNAEVLRLNCALETSDQSSAQLLAPAVVAADIKRDFEERVVALNCQLILAQQQNAQLRTANGHLQSELAAQRREQQQRSSIEHSAPSFPNQQQQQQLIVAESSDSAAAASAAALKLAQTQHKLSTALETLARAAQREKTLSAEVQSLQTQLEVGAARSRHQPESELKMPARVPAVVRGAASRLDSIGLSAGRFFTSTAPPLRVFLVLYVIAMHVLLFVFFSSSSHHEVAGGDVHAALAARHQRIAANANK
jgi:hypothetical protein